MSGLTPAVDSHSSPFSISPYTCIGLLLLFFVCWKSNSQHPNLNKIPTIGGYFGAFRFLFDAERMVQLGYDTHKYSAFKVASLTRWQVVISGEALIEEVRRAPASQLSFSLAADEIVQIPYTLGPGITADPYHVPIVSATLTRNIPLLLPDIHDEVCHSFDELIPAGDEWIQVPALETMAQILCRVSNRVFVGLPLCRDPTFLALNLKFSTDVVTAALILSMSPRFLRPLIARFLTTLPTAIKKASKILQSTISHRNSQIEAHGNDYPGKPCDMLSWLMDEAKGEQRTLRDYTVRILAINFASIHTTSMTATHALFWLAARPEYLQPLREEVEAVVKQYGWTKEGINQMAKVDSFLKESMRVSGLGSLSMMRKAVKPFTFSDGTHIPEGTFIFSASRPTHLNACNYPDAATFNGFRFVECSQTAGKCQMFVSASANWLPWGLGGGSRACPGRFLASATLKTMLAHMVLTYDIKLEGHASRPSDWWIEANCLPNHSAKVSFRKRQSRFVEQNSHDISTIYT